MEYSQFFEKKNKTIDDREFFCLMSDSPEELQELVREINLEIGSGFPNDWIYGVISEAFCALENDDLEDCLIESDLYNKDLIEWLHNSFALELCEETREQTYLPKMTIIDLISRAQNDCKCKIYEAVDDFMQEMEKVGDN